MNENLCCHNDGNGNNGVCEVYKCKCYQRYCYYKQLQQAKKENFELEYKIDRMYLQINNIV